MQSKKQVRKAVIAAAGFGTRFLPQTKAMPKEMLPLVDKPVVQYVVEELVEAGIEDIFIVTGYHKRSIEDHFDRMSSDLRTNLELGGKHDLLQMTDKISEMANFVYIRQKGPYGNGTPLMNVEHLIGDEPFIFTWSDDFIIASPSRFKQMIKAYEQHQSSIMSTVQVHNEEDYDRYGFAAGKVVKPGLVQIESIIEKPGKANATSNLATVSGCLLTADIFPYLKKALRHLPAEQELYYNAALQRMVDDGHKVYALEIDNARYYDAGNKLDYLKTVVEIALGHDELREPFLTYLKSITKD